jgi:RNA polymerase sigma-70 factor (ECF subfamily)
MRTFAGMPGVGRRRRHNAAPHTAGCATHPACLWPLTKNSANFLKSVEQARLQAHGLSPVRDDDAALDIVQDAMIRLAERYADRPADELPDAVPAHPVQRDDGLVPPAEGPKRRLLNMSDLEGGEDNPDFDLLESLVARAPGRNARTARSTPLSGNRPCVRSKAQWSELPARQREAFLLRYWEEFDVAETARVMGVARRAA